MADTTKILMAIREDGAVTRTKVESIDKRLEKAEDVAVQSQETHVKLGVHLDNHKFWNALGIGSALAAVGLGLKIVWSSLKGGQP